MKYKNIIIILAGMIGSSLIVLAALIFPLQNFSTNILMISQIPPKTELLETIKNLNITHVILPELLIRGNKVELSFESKKALKELEKKSKKPLILYSIGKNRKTGSVLISATKDEKKKKILFWNFFQLLRSADGIAIDFENTFDNFSFDDKLSLARIVDEIRTIIRKQGKIIAGNGKNDLPLKNNPKLLVWYLNAKRSNLISTETSQPANKPTIQPANQQTSKPETSNQQIATSNQLTRNQFITVGSGGNPISPSLPPEQTPTPVFSFVPKKKFITYIQNHGAIRPQELINNLISEGFTDVYVSNYEPEWTGEFIHLLKAQKPNIKVSVIAEGDCALAIDPTCGNKNLTIYQNPARVLETTRIKETNAWLQKFGSSGEKVDGIHYDVETYLGPGSFYQCSHNGVFEKCAINDLLAMLEKALLPLKNQGYEQSIVFGSSRNTTPDSGSNYSADLTRLFSSSFFQQSVSQITLLAYSDQFSNADVRTAFQTAESICQSSAFCPQLIAVIETDHVPAEPAASFFEEGRQATERMLVLTQQEEENLRSYAGQGVHHLISYHNPELVNRAVYPANIENERDVNLLAIQTPNANLNPSLTPFIFSITFNQNAQSAILSLEVKNIPKDKIIADSKVTTASGANQTTTLSISYETLVNEPEGNYEVNIFLTSNRYFDRTRTKTNNVQTLVLKKTAIPPASPILSIPMIFGFFQPNDVLNPSTQVEQYITDQAKKGVVEIPFHLGGNVTPDGKELKMSNQTPNLSSFMTLLSRIEQNLFYPSKSLRIRAYLRASLTSDDALNDVNGPGKTSIKDPVIRQNIKNLIREIAAQNKYNLDSSRIDLITIDFESIQASNYDLNDLKPGDEGLVPDIADFVREVKAMNLGKKIGVFSAGFANKNWFPSTSPWTVSPKNYIAKEDVQTLFSAGIDVIIIGAYEIFPSSSMTYVDPAQYGPLHSNFESFVRYQIQVMKDLSLDPKANMILAIPLFSGSSFPNIVPTNTAIETLQNIIASGFVTSIKAEAFDFGSADANEKTLLLNAQR